MDEYGLFLQYVDLFFSLYHVIIQPKEEYFYLYNTYLDIQVICKLDRQHLKYEYILMTYLMTSNLSMLEKANLFHHLSLVKCFF